MTVYFSMPISNINYSLSFLVFLLSVWQVDLAFLSWRESGGEGATNKDDRKKLGHSLSNPLELERTVLYLIKYERLGRVQ